MTDTPITGNEPELPGQRPKVTIRGMFEAMMHDWPHWLRPVMHGQHYALQCQACGRTRFSATVTIEHPFDVRVMYGPFEENIPVLPARDITRTHIDMVCLECGATAHVNNVNDGLPIHRMVRE